MTACHDRHDTNRPNRGAPLLYIGSLPFVFAMPVIVRTELDPDAAGGGPVFLLAQRFVMVTHRACIGSLASAPARNEL